MTEKVVCFRPDGVFVRDGVNPDYRYEGPVYEFLSILVYHSELSIDDVTFIVTNQESWMSDLPAHGFGGHAVPGGM